MKIKPWHDKLLKAIKAGPFAKRLLQQVLTDMHEIEQVDNADYDCIFALIPYAYACEKQVFLKKNYLDIRKRDNSFFRCDISYKYIFWRIR